MEKQQNTSTQYHPLFIRAVRNTLRHEGYFSDDKNDPGGATKYGISLRFLQGIKDGDLNKDGIVSRGDIVSLTEEDAIKLYHEHVWQGEAAYSYLPISPGMKLFDLAVNVGQRQANKIFQRAVRASTGINIKDDGFIGDKTMQAVAEADDKALYAAMASEAASFYRLISEQKPVFKKYLNGWLNRAYSRPKSETLHG